MATVVRPSLSFLFPTLTIAQLKSLLVRIGANTGGTKPTLISRLEQDLSVQKLPKTRTRILSIDMGIKNLAFCVCDIGPDKPLDLMTKKEKSATDKSDGLLLRIPHWQRMNVNIGSETPEKETDLSHPRILSELAYYLVDSLLKFNPTTILIERQRFRSGSGAAVQEWTVRVNMLEAMLWAALQALGVEHARLAYHKRKVDFPLGPISLDSVGRYGFPQVFDVSPARVGSYWLGMEDGGSKKGGKDENGVKKKRTPKENKDEKIAVVGKWLEHDRSHELASPLLGDDHVELSFSDQALRMKNAFRAKLAKGRKTGAKYPVVRGAKKGTGGNRDTDATLDDPLVASNLSLHFPATDLQNSTGKIDDLADCLLQAAAWAKWEDNRRRILTMSDEELLHMVKKPKD